MEGSLDHHDNYGVIPRSAEAIFEELNREELNYESFKVYCSFLEIYNEELCDLLAESDNNRRPSSPSKNHNSLAIMEGKDGPFCRGLSEKEVKNASDLLHLMELAHQSRKVGETSMNKESSRSHCIFTLKVQAKRRLEDGCLFESNGCLHMVDLAGSECAKTANLSSSDGAEQHARDRERMNINRSLLTLGRVVKLLKEQSEKGSKVRIPYRDSKLTRILQQALGGNSKTVIIATLSPSVTAIEESISTLNYAQAAHGIKNKPVSASYMSQATNASAMLSGKDAPGSGQIGSIEKWTEMETRLEYMQCQVEEAKAALARKHLQQQEFVERAEQAEADKAEMEQQVEEMTIEKEALQEDLVQTKGKLLETEQHVEELQLKNNMLTEDLAETTAKLHKTENELSETRTELEKTTIILHATQKTEASLTKECLALIKALNESIADGDQLHKVILENRETDVQRREAAKQYHKAMASLLSDVKGALVTLGEQESRYHATTTELADDAANKEMAFIDHAKTVLQTAANDVEKAVTTLKSSINDEDGIVASAHSLMDDTCLRLETAWSIVESGEQKLASQFQSTREQLADFGSQLQKLESVHSASMEETLAGLESNRTAAKRKAEELVSSTCTALESAREDRKKVREATKNTVEKWKLAMIANGESMMQKSAEQQGAVVKTMAMMDSEMARHVTMQKQLDSQNKLLSESQQDSSKAFDSQKQLFLETQRQMEESHSQQSQLLSAFVQNLMKGVETLVKNQVSEVVKEVNQGHSMLAEKNKSLVENHVNIAASTLETIGDAKNLTSSIQNEAVVAMQNDKNVLSHLDNTKSVFANLQKSAEEHNANAVTFANNAARHLQESEDLEDGVTELRQHLSGEGKHYTDLLSDAFARDTKRVSTLGEAGQALTIFTRDDVLSSVTSAVAEMERPRSGTMATFAAERTVLEGELRNGLSTIRDKATASSQLADELHNGVQSAATGFSEKTAVERSVEVRETKDIFLEGAKKHVDLTRETIGQTEAGSRQATTTTENFVQTDLSAYQEPAKAPERVQILFSDKVSSTPSENEILSAFRKLGKADVKSVLQALSPNQEKLSSSRYQKNSHRSLVQNPPHERNEPRSEHIT